MLRARALAPMWLGWILSPGLHMALFGAPAGERNEGVWLIKVICSSRQARHRLAVERDAASFSGCWPKGGRMEEACRAA